MTIPGAGSWLSIWTSGQHEDAESASSLSVFTGGQWRPGGTNKVIVNPTDKPHEIRQALQNLAQLAGNTDPATVGLVSDAGSSTHYAGELHGHKISKSALNQLLYSRVTPTAVAATAVVGTSTEPSHDDHVHSLSTTLLDTLLHDHSLDLGTGTLTAASLSVGTLAGLLWGTAGAITATMTPSITSMTVAAGTAAAPSIWWGSSPKTGLYLAGANNLAVSINETKLLDMSAAAFGVTGKVTIVADSGDCLRLTGSWPA